jgi:two-component system, response regulator PdtaR
MSNPKGRILVVDDDRLVLATLAHGLARAGYEVIDADNGDDAILLAREQRPDLALLDIRMQGKSGFDVAEYLRDHSRIPFMFLSAFSDEQTVAQAKALGAVASLVKPLDIGQLLPVVDAAFVELRARPIARPEAPAPMTPDMLIAVGVLMQRHSMTRAAALEQLNRLAELERCTAAEQAVREIEALERRAAPAAG